MPLKIIRLVTAVLAILAGTAVTHAQTAAGNSIMIADSIKVTQYCDSIASEADRDTLACDSALRLTPLPCCEDIRTIYNMPYSVTGRCYDWRQLWINTAALGGAFVGTLLVLECLPEDATTWNRAELQDVPLFKRWKNHVIKKGPEWDHDNPVFNYVLHPYAGAAYYMAARSCGFNAWQSLLYCTCVSTIGWEFGIEAFMERPSIQDIFITPIAGSIIGEGFYRLKRRIVDNNYTLGGSRFLGYAVAIIIDPVNEVIGLMSGNRARQLADCRHRQPTVTTALTPMLTYHGKDAALAYTVTITF